MSSKRYHVGALIGGITPIIWTRISLISRTSGRSVETFKRSTATSATGKHWKARTSVVKGLRRNSSPVLMTLTVSHYVWHIFLSNWKLTVNWTRKTRNWRPSVSAEYSVDQCFSTFVRPRPGKFFFHKMRARSKQIYSSIPFQFFFNFIH